MRIQLLFFAALRERVGKSEHSLVLPHAEMSVASLRALLPQHVPALEGRLEAVRFAVNQDFADEAAGLQDGDEVALIPPVSGG